MTGHTPSNRILGRKRLEFANNAELERYYEEKYRQGGYDGGGCTIHGIDISKRYHQARFESALRMLDPRPGDTVLDAGCGDGSLTALLAPRCRRVHAIDIAGNAMAAVIRSTPNVEFHKANIETLDFPAAAFDRIVCVETLEHLLHPQQAIAEFHRTLKPAGVLVVTYPTVNRTTVNEWQKKIGLGMRLDISEHLTEWSYDELVAKVEAAGFELLRSEGIAFDFGLVGRLKYVARPLARAFTEAALSIRRFPRNSSFVSAVFRRR